MKMLITLGLFAMSLSAYSCPDMTGDWLCKDSEGEVWSEQITTHGNKYRITYEKGTIDEKTEELIADGRKYKGLPSSEAYGFSFFYAALDDSHIPTEIKAALSLAMSNLKEKITQQIHSDTKIFCKDNALFSEIKFNGELGIDPKISFGGNGESFVTDFLETQNRRVGKILIKGRSVPKALSLSLSNDRPTKIETLDKTLSVECSKK